VSSADLASVPGNPQPLSLALGESPDSLLSRDALRAKQRMAYLALKQEKREAKQAAREHMRAQERAFQQKKMQDYTERFHAVRERKAAKEAHVNGGFPVEQSRPAFNLPNERHSDSAPAAAASEPRSAPPASSRPYSSTGFDESSYPTSSGSRRSYMPRDEEEEGRFGSSGGGRGGFGGRGGGRGGFGGRGGRTGGFGGRDDSSHVHRKNRPGRSESARHMAHSQGVVESFGARPSPSTSFGSQVFGSTAGASDNGHGSCGRPRS